MRLVFAECQRNTFFCISANRIKFGRGPSAFYFDKIAKFEAPVLGFLEDADTDRERFIAKGRRVTGTSS